MLTVFETERSIYLFPFFRPYLAEFDHVNETVCLPPSRLRLFAFDWASLHRALFRTRTKIDILSSRGQLPVARPNDQNEVIRWNESSAQSGGNDTARTPPLHSREVPRARWYSRMVHLDDVRTIWLVAEPYHPLGRHPSTLARSSATHPAGIITPLTPRPLDLPFSRCFSPWSSLSPARLLPFPTSSFHLSRSMLFLFPTTRPRILFLCT